MMEIMESPEASSSLPFGAPSLLMDDDFNMDDNNDDTQDEETNTDSSKPFGDFMLDEEPESLMDRPQSSTSGFGACDLLEDDFGLETAAEPSPLENFAASFSISPRIDSNPSDSYISKLLGTPIHRMMDNLARTTAAKINAENDSQNSTQSSGSKSTESTPKDMWVDRYRPKRFTDLIGDESVHREVLAWVKEWDQCVFKRKSKKRPRPNDKSQENERPADEFGRPHEKILLLAGPPGLGKTTLAHVVARQAGYSVLEINASDARTGNIIEERIKPALESGSALGSKRPVLVVVDEVDGATGENTGSFIQRLIQLTIDGKRKKSRASSKNENNPKRPLLRPIICICNDLWASSLARLRPICRIVRFNAAPSLLLVKRLKEICTTEGLQADGRALSQLVAVSQGDLRGCLNTLQIIHTQSQQVTEGIIKSATVGMKESESTAQDVWNDLFKPLSKKRIKDLGMTSQENEKYVGRLCRLIEASGMIDKVMSGCFDHYINLHQQDPSWKRFEAAQEWFGTFDHFASMLRAEQEYALMGYLPYLVTPIHHLFADSGNPKMGRPTADWECHVKSKTSEEIYKSLTRSVLVNGGRHSCGFRHLLGNEVIVTEFAPMLNRIIAPPLRPVNSQIIRPHERATLKKVVDVMVSLELRFVQERGDDGQMMYRLDPPVDVFVTYDGKRASDIAVSRYAVRHMVAAEIEAEYTARHCDAVEKKQGRQIAAFFSSASAKAKASDDAPLMDPEGEYGGELIETKNKSDTPKTLSVDIVDKPPTDFFGRPIVQKEASTTKANQTTEQAPPTKKFRVSYNYNEGSSSAVRKPVKMLSLL
ncbi:hypothetical protein FRC03_003081 [Tulasnella sp. 419]|nr:hypothetical protein FRC03_003081 [Tulasnella sp. 419]